MPLLTVAAGILVLLILIIVFKMNTFVSFILVALLVGLAQGMPLDLAAQSIQDGIGSTLGLLVVILGFGAMLGKLVADSGAAQRITSNLIDTFGLKYVQWALVLTGFIVGIPMFYSVGFVILVPLVFTVANQTKLPLLYVGLPMLASLSVTHGYLPPHPAPTAIAVMFGADIGVTLIYGIIVAIPAIIVAGPLFSRTLKKYNPKPLPEFYNEEVMPEEELPSMGVSVVTALSPVVFIGASAAFVLILGENHPWSRWVGYLGNPLVAMLLAVLLAIYSLGLRRGKKMSEISKSLEKAVTGITMVLLVIAGAGALKQILVDSGVSEYIASFLKNTSINPLLLGWLIASLIRVSVGSATVAGLTSAGIVLPMVDGTGVSPELMVLAIGSGSLMFSHVNDSGFWMFKEYFNLTIKETIMTWSIMETIVATMGIISVLLIDSFILS
jgi:Gnt-I system high-affinity gluconate transporter